MLQGKDLGTKIIILQRIVCGFNPTNMQEGTFICERKLIQASPLSPGFGAGHRSAASLGNHPDVT